MKAIYLSSLIFTLCLFACQNKNTENEEANGEDLPKLTMIGEGDNRYIDMRKLLNNDRVGIFYGSGMKEEYFYPKRAGVGEHKVIFTDRFQTKVYETFIFDVDIEHEVTWTRHQY